MHVADDDRSAARERLAALRARRKQPLDERAIGHLRGADVDHRRARLHERRRHETGAGRSRRRGCPLPPPRAGRSVVREWQIVTVACRCSSSSAIGLPTMSLRPMTTARAPAIVMFERSSSSMTPAGVHDDERRAVLHQMADVQRDGSRRRPCPAGWRRTRAARRPRPSPPAAATAPECRRAPRCDSADRRPPAAPAASPSPAAARDRCAARPRRRTSACSGRRSPTPDRRRRARCRGPAAARRAP